MDLFAFQLTTQNHRDAERMLARADELLNEMFPNDNSLRFELFDEGCTSGIFIGSLPSDLAGSYFKIVEGVVASFPDMKMRYYETCNGPLLGEAVAKDGKLLWYEPWTVVIVLQNEDSYNQLLEHLQENVNLELVLHPEQFSIEWTYDHNTEDEFTTEYINELKKCFPKSFHMVYYKYDTCDECQSDEVPYYGDNRMPIPSTWERTSKSRLALMHWRRQMEGVQYKDIMSNPEQVFQMALEKARAGEVHYPSAIAEYLFYKESLHSLKAEDYSWLKKLADKGNEYACCILLLGMERTEAGPEGTLFEPDETLKQQYTQTVCEKMYTIDDMRIACHYPFDNLPLRKKLVEQGAEAPEFLIQKK